MRIVKLSLTTPLLSMESAIHPKKFQLPSHLRDSVKAFESGFQELYQSAPLISLHAHFAFETLGKIGEGGMGSIYQIRDHRLNRIAALKLLSDKNATEEARQRFFREAVITAGLDHPAIPPIYETGLTADGDLYMLLRMIRGQTLRQVIKECHDLGKLERRDLVEIMIKVAEAVAYAHSQGIIHRDLKPDNIMVGEFGEVLVIDWGIAKDLNVTESEQTDKILECVLSKSELEQVGVTVSGTMVGTPGYMAPEQIDGLGIDERADVFALGLILVEILTGKRAVSGDTTIDRVAVTASGSALTPRDIDSRLSSEIDWIAKEAMELDPEDRTQGAEEFVSQLRAYFNGEEVPGYSYSLVERTQRAIKRRPGLIVSTAVGALLLALIGNLWLTLELEGQKRLKAEKNAVVATKKLGVAEDEAERAKAALNLFNEARNLVERGAPQQRLKEKINEALKRGGRTKNQLLTAARIYSDASFNEDSKALLEEAVKRFPPCYEGLFALHTQEVKLANRGFYGTPYLMKLLSESKKRGDENEYTLFADAFQLSLDKRWDESIATYSRIEEYSTSFTLMYNNRGIAWKEKGEFEKALADYSRAIEIDSRIDLAFFNRGFIWQIKGDYDKALADYNRTLEINPRSADAYTNRGFIWQMKGDYDQALIDYAKALELNPRESVAFFNRGVILKRLGQLDKALINFNKAIQIDPRFTKAYTSRGDIWSGKGELDRALADYNMALKINPQYAEALGKRGVVWKKKGDIDKAMVDYNRAIELDSRLDAPLNNRGLLWKEKGDFDKALADFNKSIELNPRAAVTFTNRGHTWEKKGDFDKALVDYNKAIEFDPQNTLALFSRGLVFGRKGRYSKALADVTKAIELKHKDPMVYYIRGYLYFSLKEPKAACLDLETFLRLAPKHPQAPAARRLLAQARAQLGK